MGDKTMAMDIECVTARWQLLYEPNPPCSVGIGFIEIMNGHFIHAGPLLERDRSFYLYEPNPVHPCYHILMPISHPFEYITVICMYIHAHNPPSIFLAFS